MAKKTVTFKFTVQFMNRNKVGLLSPRMVLRQRKREDITLSITLEDSEEFFRIMDCREIW